MLTTQPSRQQKEKKSICASLTVKGRPCKAWSSAHWTPFCNTHTPHEPVEFVGGGPLDGLRFGTSFCHLVRQDEICVVRTRGGKVVVIAPGIGDFFGPRTTLGVYRQAFHELVLVWQWEPVAESSNGRR